MKVIVTGANSSLGLAAARMLVRAGHYVIAFVHNVDEFRRLCREERVGVLEGDILDRSSVTAVDRADAVVHCAHFPPRDHGLNWDALRHALEAVRPGGYFVYPGDVRAYTRPQSGGEGEGAEGGGEGGGEELRRVGPDAARAAARREDALRLDLERAVLAQSGTVIHLAEIFGAGVRGGRLARAFRLAVAGRRTWFPGALDVPHEFVHVDDAARALVAPLGRRVARGRAYAAPGPAPVTPREFIESIYRSLGRRPRVGSLPDLWMRVRRAAAPDPCFPAEFAYAAGPLPLLDGSRILAELGWMAEVPYGEGVRRTARWLRELG